MRRCYELKRMFMITPMFLQDICMLPASCKTRLYIVYPVDCMYWNIPVMNVWW